MAPRSEPPALNLFLRKTKIGAHRWSSCASRFCFSFAQDAVPKASCAAPETGRANHAAASVWKKENGMEELGVSSEVLQEPPQPWLDLTNLAVTKEYHSLS